MQFELKDWKNHSFIKSWFFGMQQFYLIPPLLIDLIWMVAFNPARFAMVLWIFFALIFKVSFNENIPAGFNDLFLFSWKRQNQLFKKECHLLSDKLELAQGFNIESLWGLISIDSNLSESKWYIYFLDSWWKSRGRPRTGVESMHWNTVKIHFMCLQK